MNDLLQAVLEDPSVRQAEAMELVAVDGAEAFDPWSSESNL